jgi:hypothetical protein
VTLEEGCRPTFILIVPGVVALPFLSDGLREGAQAADLVGAVVDRDVVLLVRELLRQRRRTLVHRLDVICGTGGDVETGQRVCNVVLRPTLAGWQD